MKSEGYHFIIVGAGAAGLSLLMHMIQSGRLHEKKIILIDKAPKTENDRTWCFWEEEAGLFEPVVYKKWDKLWFHGNDGSSSMNDINPYSYKMIRGIDFYQYCFEIINRQNNISVEFGVVEKLKSENNKASLTINDRTIEADYIFSSVNPDLNFNQSDRHFLWQHFKGWWVHSTVPVFNAAEATLMDFRVDQKSDTRFVYVMPFSSTDALVEYTVFSKTLLSNEEYDSGLTNYCEEVLKLSAENYRISSSEFGKIPMTDINFTRSDGRIIYIGTAGGQTKASSGYTFKNIQKHSAAIVRSLIDSGSPNITGISKKFQFYDGVLLQVLSENKVPGATVFTRLFSNNSMMAVMKFLDNETSIAEDIKLINALPKSKFISAAFSQLLK